MNVFLGTKDLLLESCKMKNDLECQASDNKAFLELLTVKNAFEISKEHAKCCCEMKELAREQTGQVKDHINYKSAQTNDLFGELENTRVRDALNTSNIENLILRLRGKECHSDQPDRR